MRNIPSNARVLVRVTAPVSKRCPFVDEIDVGTVTLTWSTDGKTAELHALREWLDTFKDRAISHEDFTREVADRLNGQAESTWMTAGMEVRCST
jgi:NADPH-dependent 7-cyano-7-deazaguanine reductase QueF